MEHFKSNILFVLAQATLQSQHNVTGDVFTLHNIDLHGIRYFALFIKKMLNSYAPLKKEMTSVSSLDLTHDHFFAEKLTLEHIQLIQFPLGDASDEVLVLHTLLDLVELQGC